MVDEPFPEGRNRLFKILLRKSRDLDKPVGMVRNTKV